MTDTSLREEMQEIRELVEKNIQQHSSAHSDMIHKMDVMERNIQPVVDAFNESKQYKMVWTKTGITIIKYSKFTIALFTALGIIFAVLKYGVKLLLK